MLTMHQIQFDSKTCLVNKNVHFVSNFKIKFITFSFLIQYIANFGLTWLEFIENNNHAFTNVNKKNIFQILVKFYSKIFEIEF